MSCIFVITPILVSAWPSLVALASSAATTLGYRLVKSSLDAQETARSNAEVTQALSLEVENSEVIADQIRRGESMVIARDDIRIVISLDAMGRITAHVEGSAKRPKSELEEAGQQFLNHLIQQYAYQQIMLTMKDKGFSLVEESLEKDGRIRMKVRKFE